MADHVPDGLDMSNLPAWAQAAATIGVTAAAFFWWMKGKWSDPTLAISQTRAEATQAVTDVFMRETQANREILVSNKETMTATRDAIFAMRDAIFIMRDAMLSTRESVNKLVETQSEISRLMKEQRDSDKELAQQARLLEILHASERERESARRISREKP